MDFGRSHEESESLTSKSNIRVLPVPTSNESDDLPKRLDSLVVKAANTAAVNMYRRRPTTTTADPTDAVDDADHAEDADASLYPERSVTRSSVIEPEMLVVIFEAFDNLNFVYAEKGAIFNNRNGHFHHDDFLGKPFGCKIRARNNRGLGFVYLLRPTVELWTRSLNHRTQIVHELDASVVVFRLGLRPGMVVCESGTGSGAMSHAVLRTIAPDGRLHTFEFNKNRAEAAREEFRRNGVDQLVTVRHVDVCRRGFVTTTTTEEQDDENEQESHHDEPSSRGDERILKNVDAVFLDLPEPWLAVPHAARSLKGNARIGSYSPCVEQSQRTVQALKAHGFHSVRTIEVRLREHYVDEVELEMPPTMRLKPKQESSSWNFTMKEKEGQASAVAVGTNAEESVKEVNENAKEALEDKATNQNDADSQPPNPKKRKMLCARPFGTMRGHTAFLTFATSAYKSCQDNKDCPKE